MIFTLKDPDVPEGTLLLFGIRYGASTSGKVYTFAALKAGGRWYFTGTGPSDASWTAVQRWLQRDGRQVVWIKVATRLEMLWEAGQEVKPSLGDDLYPYGPLHPKDSDRPMAHSYPEDADDASDADELLDDVNEFPSAELPDGVYGLDDYGVDPRTGD